MKRGRRSSSSPATRLGLLYGSNTAGATAGVLACGFVLVPQIGVQASNWLAAGINLAVGLAAVLVARSAAPVPAPAAQTAPLARDRSTLGLLAVAALCGGLALAFETVWFRALVLVFGSTCYSFAIMVACFLLGIALGSGVLGRVANQPARAAWALAVALGGSGLWTLLSMRFYVAAPERLLSILARFDFRWTGMLIAKASLAALFLLPRAILSGLAFTAVVRLIRDRTASAGRVLSVRPSASTPWGPPPGPPPPGSSSCRDLEAAARKLPHSADIWQNYAFFLEQAGRTREAHAAAARAKALDRR